MAMALLATAGVQAAVPDQGTVVIVPQIAGGFPWQTYVNVTAVEAGTLTITQYEDIGGGATQEIPAWFPGPGGPLIQGQTVTFQTPAAPNLTTGFVVLQSTGDIEADAIFTQTVPGLASQTGTAAGTHGARDVIIHVDNTGGQATTLALVNPTATPETVYSAFQPASGGASVQSTPFPVPAMGHLAVTTASQFPSTANASGALELYTPAGEMAVAALFFTGGGFTTQTPHNINGPPVIVTGTPVNVSGVWAAVGGSAPTGPGANSVFFAMDVVQTGNRYAAWFDKVNDRFSLENGEVTGSVFGNTLTISGMHTYGSDGCGDTIESGTVQLEDGVLGGSFTPTYDSSPACGSRAGSAVAVSFTLMPVLNLYRGTYTEPGGSAPAGVVEFAEDRDGNISGTWLPDPEAPLLLPGTFTGTTSGNLLTLMTNGSTPTTFTAMLGDDVAFGSLPDGSDFYATLEVN